MSVLQSQWVSVFRAGDYGTKGKYSTADLDQIVADSRPDEIPAVLGHPHHDSPAFGWVKQFRRNGDELEARFDQVDPQFEDAVKNGRYKKRSIALVREPDGKLRVRHVGWLGAAPPEVKGLQDAKFNESNFEAFDFAEEEPSVAEEQKLTFSEWLGKLLGRTPTDTAATPDIDSAVRRAVDAAKAEFSQQVEAQRSETKRIETEFSEFRKSVVTSGSNARVAGLIAGLKASKRWIPAYDKMGVPELFNALASGATTEIQFGEGTSQKKLDAVQLFSDILNGVGQIVPEGALVKFDAGKGGKPIEVKEGVDANSVLFHHAVEKHAKDKNIPYTQAYTELKREGWKPEHTGASSAGAV